MQKIVLEINLIRKQIMKEWYYYKKSTNSFAKEKPRIKKKGGILMAKKIFKMGVALIMCLVLLVGCGEDIATDRIYVTINVEYKEKFLAEDFSTEDFKWDNIERMEYGSWYGNIEPESGTMMICFKKHGKKQVKDAKKHFETLVFVDAVSFDGNQTNQ